MKNKRIDYKHGGSHDGNALARREEKRTKKGMGGYAMKRKQAAMGRYMYGHGGDVKMEGSQPKYKGTPKCMPN